MPDALIIDACRTPRGIGKQGKGALAHLHPQHVAATVLRALVERNGFDTLFVDGQSLLNGLFDGRASLSW